MRIGRTSLSGSHFVLTFLYCLDLVPLLLVGWQVPPFNFTIASEYSAGLKPFAAFRTTIDSISIWDNISLITPGVHILSLGNFFNEPQIRFAIPTEGINLIIISNYIEKILIRFRPPGYDIPDFMPLIINNKR